MAQDPNTRPMTSEEINSINELEALRPLVDAALELQRTTKGRRFSTHEEGQATMRLMFEWAMEDIGRAADGFNVLWNMLKDGEINEEYYDVMKTSSQYLGLGVAQLIDLLAAMRKLGDGVVHEPK